MYSSVIEETFQKHGVPVPRASLRSYSTHQVINLLATDRFVSALSGHVLRFNADRFSLKVLPVDVTFRSWPVGIVTLKNRTINPVVQTFIDAAPGSHPLPGGSISV
jgi:DNA-binding transcriptional LysR family regulator